MKRLQIEKTRHTMAIDLDPETGILDMEGSSYPENALEFFGQIIDWIKNYIAQTGKPILLNIRLNYLNTSSTKSILDIFEILNQYYKSGGQVKVNWHYAEDDEDIMETGEELGEDFEFLIEFIPYKP